MAKQHSTGALTPEQKKAQDERYAQNHEYDYIIIGAGSAALTVGSLLAKHGHKVCLLEAHDIPGGYAHTFRMADWGFCAQIHYIWGCGKDQKINQFLSYLGLDKDIEFELMGGPGYDQASLPDGKRVFIPYGWENLVKNIEEAYPGQGKNVQKFLDELQKILDQMGKLPDNIKWWHYITKSWQLTKVIKYRYSTVQDLFDKFNIAKEAQLILAANAGDMGLPPERLSIFMYAGLFGGYNTGSYYPTKHFSYYIGRLASFIEEHEGCHIYYETKAVKVNTEGKEVTSVETEDGKTFKTKNLICNMDPQLAAKKLIGWDKFPKDDQEKLTYDYSFTGVMVYLGLKDIDLRDHGFGSYNIWHNEEWDMNEMWVNQEKKHNFDKPWFFLSTPTLHTDDPGNSPEGGQVLELTTLVDYQPFKDLKDKGDLKGYNKLKADIAKKMIEITEEKFVPNLRKHIALQVIGSPTTNEDFCLAPRGNAYGAEMTPKNIAGKRLTAETPFDNFWWCNATSGFGGISGTVSTGIQLFQDLTGELVYDRSKVPDDGLAAKAANKQLKKQGTENGPMKK